jgi:hypothetical protein
LQEELTALYESFGFDRFDDINEEIKDLEDDIANDRELNRTNKAI